MKKGNIAETGKNKIKFLIITTLLQTFILFNRLENL